MTTKPHELTLPAIGDTLVAKKGGKRYYVSEVANAHVQGWGASWQKQLPILVVYKDKRGVTWARPLDQVAEKFDFSQVDD